MNVSLHELYCNVCGIVFAVPTWFDIHKRETKNDMFCPNGHTLSYRKTTADVLREELAATKRLAEFRDERLTECYVKLEKAERKLAKAEKAKKAVKR